jgi:hypothetical protein
VEKQCVFVAFDEGRNNYSEISIEMYILYVACDGWRGASCYNE